MSKKIVTIGGGSGQYVLLSGIRNLPGIDITAIVSMADSGGSTGKLRDEYGVLPPGDILKCLIALAKNRQSAWEILGKRFKGYGRLDGHVAGNLLLTIFSQHAGNFALGVKALGDVLAIRGQVLPVTLNRATLAAELDDGSWLYGEAAIDIPKSDGRAKIIKIFLVPHHQEQIAAYLPALDAIKQADYIIIGPGDLYTSLAPNFLLPDVVAALAYSSAKLIFIINIMTKYGETDNFTASDFILKIENLINREIDYILMNNKLPPNEVLTNYHEQKARIVEFCNDGLISNRKVIVCDILSIADNLIRHDSIKLSRAINKIIDN